MLARLFVCWIALAAVAYAQEPPKLRYQFTEGQTLRYRVTQAATVSGEAGAAGAFEMKTEQVTELAWRVKSVDGAGLATIEQTVAKLKFTNSSPVGEVGFDSQSDEPAMGVAAMLTPAARTLLETPVAFTVSPAGLVGPIKASADLIGALERVPGAAEVLEGEPALRSLIEALLPPLPGGKGRVTKKAFPAVGELEMQSTSTLDSVTPAGKVVIRPIVRVTGEAVRKSESGGVCELQSPQGVVSKIEAKQTIEIATDQATARVVMDTGVALIEGDRK